MKILYDTSIILDVLLDREPFAHNASIVLSYAEKGSVQGLLCATTITTIHYLCTKALGRTQSNDIISYLLDSFEIAPVTKSVLQKATTLPGPDFEDSVLCISGLTAGSDVICTRDSKGFANYNIKQCTPHELIVILYK